MEALIVIIYRFALPPSLYLRRCCYWHSPPMPVSVRMVVAHLFSVLMSYDVACNSYKYMHGDPVHTAGRNELLHGSIQALMPEMDEHLAFQMRVLDSDSPRYAEFQREMSNVFKMEASYHGYFRAHVELSMATTDLMLAMANAVNVDDDAVLEFMNLNLKNSEDDWKQRSDALNVVWRAKNNLLDDLYENRYGSA